MGDTRKDGNVNMQKSAVVLKAEMDEKIALGYTTQVLFQTRWRQDVDEI